MARSDTFHEALVRAPMLRLTLPFIMGLVLARVFHITALWPGALAVGLAVLWFILSGRVRVYGQRWWRGALLYPALVFFGIGWQALRAPDRTDTLARQRATATTWRMRVTEAISAGPSTMRLWARADAVLDSAGVHSARGGVLLTLVLDSAVALPASGDELLVHAHLDTMDRVPDPGGFDQRAWAASYGVRHACFAPSDQWSTLRRATGWASFFEGARRRISGWLEASDLDARERGMVKAILLGIRDELDADQKTAFARSGTMHVLAVSGSHVAIVYAALLGLLERLGGKRPWRIARSVIILIVLWAYAGITGATPSVLRATVTFTFFCLADMAGRMPGPVNSLSAAAFLLPLWDPLMLGQLSFQLSFLAVAGIALFYRPIMRLWAAPNRVLHYFWSLFAVSIAAQLMTTPLALLSFSAFPVWFLPANLVVVGLVALGVYAGTVLLLLQWIPVAGDVCTWVMLVLLKLIGWTTHLFAWLPGAYPPVRIDVWQCAGLYAFVLLMAAAFFEGWRWARAGTLATVALLLGSWAWSAHQRNGDRRFVVYDDRDQLICAVQSGRQLTVLADSLDPWAARKVDTHRRAIGAWAVDTVPLPGRLEMADLRVQWIAGGQRSLDSVTPADLFIVADDARYDPDRLSSEALPKGGVVLSPAMGWKRRAFWRRWCESRGVPVHDVKQRGAYVR